MSTTLSTVDWVGTERITGENDPDGYPDTFNRACKQIWDIFTVQHDKDGDHKSDLLTHYFQMEEGTYAGDEADDRTISLTDTNLIPVFVMVFSDTTTPLYLRLESSIMSGDNSKMADDGAGFEADHIQDTGTGSFEIGASLDINEGTPAETYYYVVFGTY